MRGLRWTMSVGSSVSRFLSFLTVLVSCLPLSVRHPHHSSREERGSGRKEATERRDVEWCGWGRSGSRLSTLVSRASLRSFVRLA